MRVIATLLTVAALGFLPSLTVADTIYVDDDNVAGPWDGSPEFPFRFIQDAIDNASSGDTIDAAAGLYLEPLLIQDKTNLELRGEGAEQTVIDGQRIGHVVEIIRSTVAIHGFTIRFSRDELGTYSGVKVAESTVHIHDNIITDNRGGIRSTAFGDEAPSHLFIERNRITRTSVFSAIEILNVTVQDQTGLIASNVITDNGNHGVVVRGGSIDIVGNTIANNTGYGIYTTPQVPHRIVNNIIVNNQYGILVLGGEQSEIDLVHIAYNDVWNNTDSDYWESWGGPGLPSGNQTFDPLPGTGEIHLDPMFLDPAGGDYGLPPSSPSVDAGEPPDGAAPVTCSDVTGGPRLRDADGDGLAQHDMGAYEIEDPTRQPGEVSNVRWAAGSPDLLLWDVEPTSESYDVYRDDLAALGRTNWGACQGTTPGTSFSVTEVPPAGSGFFFVVTGRTSADGAGSMGFATCIERSNYTPCQ